MNDILAFCRERAALPLPHAPAALSRRLKSSESSRGVIFLSEGAAAERGFVLMWRQEWAVVNKAYNALYRAQGLYKAVAALMRVPAVPADFDRLISSGRLIHVAL